MRNVIIYACLLILAITFSVNCNTKNHDVDGAKDKEANKDFKQKDESIENEVAIKCIGEKYSIFPNLDDFKNKLLAEKLNKIKKNELEKPSYSAPYDFFVDDIQFYISSQIKNNIIPNEGYSNCFLRIDGEKIAWAPVVMLPSNGEFIMTIIVYWEKDVYEPVSKGFYLTTFSLKGELLSLAYIGGYEEFDSYNNKEKLSGIWGQAYCINTDKPIVRKAVNWDSYANRGGFIGTTLEVKEIQYSIDEKGYVKVVDEKLIFPRKCVKWKDRDSISFYSGSDTIKKLLGVIKEY